MRLKNHVIWITGSGKRVGRVMALACAAEGADIVVHCRSSREEAEQVTEEIERMGRRAMLVQGDHGRVSDVERMVGEIREGFGRLSALVNNAAIYPKVKFEDASEDEFFEAIRSNCYGPFLTTQKALPLLREAKPGRVINFIDWSVRRPYKYYGPYMAAKGGLWTLTKALAKELAPDVLVNGIAPGPILEPPDFDERTRENILSKTPLARWGSPDDVLKALLYLLEQDYATGSIITVDGGRSVW